MSAAKAAKREAALQRRQLQRQIEGAQLASLQDHNNRMANLQVFLGTNDALSGISGRDMGQIEVIKLYKKELKKKWLLKQIVSFTIIK
ncbi:MAG: hypothetical protein CM15mV132_130 [uncultured marine virus]|nr:MAG: hypothetical protein CM15mV132_130 [uncultured marine virus]